MYKIVWIVEVDYTQVGEENICVLSSKEFNTEKEAYDWIDSEAELEDCAEAIICKYQVRNEKYELLDSYLY